MDMTTLLIGVAVIVPVTVIAIKVAKAIRHRKAVRRRLYTITEGRQPLYPRVAEAAARGFHSGGVIRRSDISNPDVPVILKRGEEYCFHSKHTTPVWSQDGFVARCLTCRATLYYGDGDVATDKPVAVEPYRFRAVEPDHGLIESDTPIHPLQAEVTSGRCDLCDLTLPLHDADCPRLIAEDMLMRHRDRFPAISTPWTDEGDELPAAMLHTPNLGGEGNPEYQGPHYDSVHGVETRFAEYDMLRAPPEGAAVYTIGQAHNMADRHERHRIVGAFGPLPIEGEDDGKPTPE